MKTRASKHRPRRRRARPLLVAVAGTMVLGGGCLPGTYAQPPHDLAVGDLSTQLGVVDLGLVVTDQSTVGVGDLGPYDLMPPVDGGAED